jgi:cytochrome c553
MRVLSVVLRLGAAAAALVFSAGVEARDRSFSAEYKATHYCMLCHGRGARGFTAYRPIPQLAGQQAQYIELQLTAFAERRRQRNLGYVRYENVHKLTPGQRTALAEYMSKLEPVPHKSAPEKLIAAGAALFNNGAPENDVPACAVCHGPDAKGSAIFPRLAGQWKPYLVGQLTNWDKQRGLGPEGKEDNSNIMAPIAKSLTSQQIDAVAAYLSSLN